MASESFDILAMSEFEFKSEVDSFDIFDMDNILYDIPQEIPSATKTSPFHQSDSGVSEMSVDFNPGSVASTGSEESEKMLDDLVESIEFSPFGEGGADQDLLDYIGRKRSNRYALSTTESFDEDNDQELNIYSRQSSSSESSRDLEPLSWVQTCTAELKPHDDKENEVINYKTRSVTSSKSLVNTNTVTPNKFPKVVLKPCAPGKKNLNTCITVVEDQQSSKIKSIKVLKVIKASPSATTDETAAEVTFALDDRNRKNAVNAKMNREKKKAYMGTLEKELSQFKEENHQLKFENNKLQSDNVALEEQVQYFKSVLANQSTLSKVLNTMENLKGVRLSSSISSGSRKRGLKSDHTYGAKSRKTNSTSDSTASSSHSNEQSAGVCLHVNDDMVSLEFCSHCASMAESADNLNS